MLVLLYSSSKNDTLSSLFKDYAASIEVFDSLLRKDESRQELLLCGMGRIALQVTFVTVNGISYRI